MPLPRSSIPAGPPDLTLSVCRCCPRKSDDEDTRDAYFGTQYRGFNIRCLRFK